MQYRELGRNYSAISKESCADLNEEKAWVVRKEEEG